MNTTTALLDKPLVHTPAQREVLAPHRAPRRHPEPLLREALGMTLRGFRADKGVTLRELATMARVSPGYLSELERGRKEVSSELLAAICHGLGATVSEVLLEAVGNMAMQSMDEELASTTPAASEA
ncbi:helix-turn-helix transcriptional regulator [Corynebacterium incognita]|uniref:Helix-turn-helix transcriptional regulator n=1 Tax=Corynebacterium incognita TaxID=2754725 RepID=A0A7G7CQ63_9CORY|nr:helix-turn-helix transcriptional regulator [Corynebacterium incognita]QNE89729.1 helix-turn-helix transcriptional regulator [Corynebacterium incognita]